MQTILTQPIKDKCAWKGHQLSNQEDWIIHLDDHLLAVLDRALQSIKKANKQAPDFKRSDIKVDDEAFLELANFIAEELENGYGFVVIKGLSAEKYSEEDLTNLFYLMGIYLGEPVTQNKQQQLLGYVENVADDTNKLSRVYQTNSNLPFHSDLSDVVGLISIRKAKSGGESSLVSFASVYNTILEEHPEYLAYYYHPAFYDHLGGDEPSLSPIFSYWDGKLACRYLRKYIELGHERMNRPMSRVQTEALDIFDEISHRPEFRLDMILEPGDIQLCNNYVVMHSRNAFEDYEDKDKNRKLVRLWLKMSNARKLAADFPGKNGFSDGD